MSDYLTRVYRLAQQHQWQQISGKALKKLRALTWPEVRGRLFFLPLQMRLRSRGRRCRISPQAWIVAPWRIVLGDECALHPHCHLRTDSASSFIRLGSRTEIQPYALLMTYGGSIVMGEDCRVNPYCVLYGHGGLRIGNGVRIAAHTVIIPSSHGFDDLQVPMHQQPATSRGIVIEDDVWIGAGARIVDGTRIGTGSVIGAHAVVTHDIPPYSIAVGVPARVIRRRGEHSARHGVQC